MMSDQLENLMLTYLRRLDSKLDQVMETQGDHGRRLIFLELAVGNLASTEAGHFANTMLRMDALTGRLDRVEGRLEITAGP
jgi:hypothetical protein